MTVELVELAPLPGKRVRVDRELTIGRQGCDVTIASPQISRRHAQIASSGDDAEITDLGSRNGTFVNDARIAGAQALSPGDRVRVGETTWEIELVGEQPAEDLAPRGDVPAPPSGAHEVPAAMRAPAPAAAAPAPAPASGSPVADPAPPRASAARRMEATLISYAVVTLTAIGVVLYLVLR